MTSGSHLNADTTSWHQEVTAMQSQRHAVFPLGLQLWGGLRHGARRGHRHKRLKESWCSCVSFNDSSQYNNWTIILTVHWTKHRNMSFYDNYPQSVQLLSLQFTFLAFWKKMFWDICGLKFLISQELFQKVLMKVFICRCFLQWNCRKQVKVGI